MLLLSSCKQSPRKTPLSFGLAELNHVNRKLLETAMEGGKGNFQVVDPQYGGFSIPEM